MCWRRATVIVIVKSRNNKSVRFSFINVQKESRMVARLPEQVLLLLVLVTRVGAMAATEDSLQTTPTSNSQRGVTKVTALSTLRVFEGRGASVSISGHSSTKRPSTDFLKQSSALATDSSIPKNFGTKLAFSILEAESVLYSRTKIKKSRHFEKDGKFNEQRAKKRNLLSMKKNKKNNDKQRTSSLLPNQSANKNFLSSVSYTKGSTSHGARKETWGLSSSTPVNPLFKSLPPMRYQRASRSVLLTPLPAPWAPLLSTSSSLSTDLPLYATSHRSITMNSRAAMVFGYSKATSLDLNLSRIGSTGTRELNLEQRSTYNDDSSFQDEIKNFDDSDSLHLNTPNSIEKIMESLYPSLTEKLPQTAINNVTVNSSLIHNELVKSSTIWGKQKVSFSVNISSLRMITSSIPAAFHTLEITEKLSQNFGLVRKLQQVLPRTISNHEGSAVLSKRFDTSSPDILSVSMNDRPIQEAIPKIYRRANNNAHAFGWVSTTRKPLPATPRSSTGLGFSKRYIRDAQEDPCEKFRITDHVKREFYSPNYPDNYPPNTNCVRTLEAEKGMLLKLDFRDHFELEPMMPVNEKVGECRFDYLEVRDGQYGFSTLLGVFCDKQFPPEIISKSRYLWLRFRSDDTIEYQGFKAIWSTVPRPTSEGVPPEQEPCVKNVTIKTEAILGIDDIKDEKKIAEEYKIALDCLWIITAPANTRMQLTFDAFKLDKPNDCGANFLDIFGNHTDVPSRLRNFCGSIAEPISSASNTMYIRFYLEPKAINGIFKTLITVIRDKGSSDKPCNDDEYDCDDATCIGLSLKCNKRYNCRFLRDEDPSMCGTTADQFDSSRVIIILVIFSLIMFGMCFAFVFNCIRKLMRDHRIIREHIRQSRENRLDEIGRKMTPCPVSLSRTDLHDHGSESPSVEVDSSKELIPATSLTTHEYTKELVLEIKYGTNEMNDIHQSNNVSNATQERLQESNEELEMCDSSCQTRESLFEPKAADDILSSAAFSTFSNRKNSGPPSCITSSRRDTPQEQENLRYHHQQQHQHHAVPGEGSQPRELSYPINSPPSARDILERCSVCMSSTAHEGSIVICPKHNTIPAPPGWSFHEPPYPIEPTASACPDGTECSTSQRYQIPKSDWNTMMINRSNQKNQRRSPLFTQQNEGGFRERAEAVIEVDQQRPFSMESTKSAPDVIATH